jgi:hypothetical protein
MSTKQYSNPMLNTLGFFFQGVPTVFISNGIFFQQKAEHAQYRKFYGECVIDRSRNTLFTGKDLLRGCAYEVTTVHEIKHFHDALLCRPLFELFLLRNSVSWLVAQLAGNFRGLSVDRLPLNYEVDYPDLLTPEGAMLFPEVRRQMSVYSRQYAHVFQPVRYEGSNLTLSYLLEANAMMLELAHVLSVHGKGAAQHYYDHVVLSLPPEYNYLLRIFVRSHGNLTAAMEVLYTLLAYSLYCSDSPVQTFVKALERGDGDAAPSIGRLQAAVMTEPFDGEEKLKGRIERMRLFALDGGELDLGQARSNPVVGPMLSFHQTIYECRKLLLDVYIGWMCILAGLAWHSTPIWNGWMNCRFLRSCFFLVKKKKEWVRHSLFPNAESVSAASNCSLLPE